MANSNDDYILCADDASLPDAITAIQSSTEVIFDCEGEDLGRKGGSLSLISFRTLGSVPSKTYLFDVISLTDDTLRPLFGIIRSTAVTEIIFDGRMDFSELYHERHVALRGVLDLQLVDVASRRQRGEDEDDQHRRLSPYLHRREIAGQPNSYSKVHTLCGLEQCLKEHKVISDESQEYKSVTHSAWLNRPLPEQYLLYAAKDVYLMEQLYKHFKRSGYITDELLVKSGRYVAIWQEAKPEGTDDFKGHGLLPLGILDYQSHDLTRSCVGCHRNLPQAAYSKAAGKGYRSGNAGFAAPLVSGNNCTRVGIGIVMVMETTLKMSIDMTLKMIIDMDLELIYLAGMIRIGEH